MAREGTRRTSVEVGGRTTVWILGDQLSPRISSLEGLRRDECVVLMIESLARARQIPYHQQKLTLVWSAMRHFAGELDGLGYRVDYFEEAPDFESVLALHLGRRGPREIRIMADAEHGVTERLAAAARKLGAPVRITANNQFVSDHEEFARDAEGRKSLVLEAFYRKMRRKTGLLMDGAGPATGRWNYDRENRRRPPRGHEFPPVPAFRPDDVTEAVMDLVEREAAGHFGEIEEFAWPVTRAQAEAFLEDFLDRRLDLFGPYEDAIVVGQRALYHSLLSPLLNIGLLDPLEVCRRAEARWREGRARISSVEGFIRQVLGWREFVYQVYRLEMPQYAKRNFLEADLPLPAFYWTGDTDLACIADAVRSLRRWGINHHIQRLMVTGNFALIAGIDPQAVLEWYWLAYVDAFEWVVAPNVLGLALYADGGRVATKPYAASAGYLNRMSDCCAHCDYDPKLAVGDRACPFNALYWDFLARNRRRLAGNPRMKLVLGLLARQDRGRLAALRRRAGEIRDRLRAHGRI